MKILLIRLSALGDLVYVSAVLEGLRQHQVHLLLYQAFAPLYQEDPRVHRLWTLPRGATRRELRSLAASLQAEGFDLAADLHRKPLTHWLLRHSGARRRIHIHKASLARRLHLWFRVPLREVPVYRRYLAPFQKLGLIPEPGPLPRLPRRARPPALPLPERYVALAPEAVYPTREWPYFGELALHLERRGVPVVLLGRQRRAFPAGQNLTGRTTLSQMIAVLQHAAVVVSNDSGPAHVAAASGVPTVVLFGPTVPTFGFRPQGPAPVRVLENPRLRCRPCSLHGERPCRFFSRPCLRSLSPEQVLAATLEFWEAP